jgi:hypothetical protein
MSPPHAVQATMSATRARSAKRNWAIPQEYEHEAAMYAHEAWLTAQMRADMQL